MSVISIHESAKRDLVEHFVYMAENAGIVTADRFLANAESTFEDLARYPMMGAALHLQRPELVKVRKWRTKDFDKYLIF